jgi:hypothetical protein
MALSVNGQILFVQTEGGVSVAVFRVENNGAMTLVDTAGDCHSARKVLPQNSRRSHPRDRARWPTASVGKCIENLCG